MRVQLLYFAGCPNVEQARQALRQALLSLHLPPHFEEIDTSAPGAPEASKGWGSPTILVDGQDAFGATGAPGATCRLYGDGEHGAPTEEALRMALSRALGKERHVLQSLALVPAVVLAALPHVTCPACWPAYAALLSALGLGFLSVNRVLDPLMAGALLAGIASIAWSSRSHRHWGPLWLTLVGSAGVAAGRLVWSDAPVLYGGTLLLVVAALWNLRLKRGRTPGPATPSGDASVVGDETRGASASQ